MADKAGEYKGSSANISGNGFAGMSFSAKAETDQQFSSWVKASQKATDKLTLSTYTALTKPSRDNKVTYYSAPSANLYQYVMMKYMLPGGAQ
jgi:cytochrome o ubiquinol oxidase subunit 2